MLAVFKDPLRPFVTIVEINGIEHGKGAYLNKKQSKQMAAESALDNLCPGAFPKTTIDPEEDKGEIDYWELPIDDERILQQGGKDNQKTPAQVLQEYCNREHVDVEWQSEIDLHNTFKLSCGLSGVNITAEAKNKRDAKQRAAQLLLKALHPDIDTWGDLVDIYAPRRKEEKSEPNFRLLDKLKKEMAKMFFAEQSAVATNTIPPVTLNNAIQTPPSMTDLKFPPLRRISKQPTESSSNNTKTS